MGIKRVKFTTTFDEKLLEEFRLLAVREKKPVSKMLEELMRKLLEEKLNQ